MAKSKGISLKKRHGQNFLREERYVYSMFDAVTLTDTTSVLEIGCGDGFLTRAILKNSIARLRVYEIDEEWVRYIAETVLDEVGITVNKNAIPFDTRPPYDPSGIRIGTPSMTSRGMKEADMEIIASIMADVIANPNDDSLKQRCHSQVRSLCEQYPIYPSLSYT